MACICSAENSTSDNELRSKLHDLHHDMVDNAKRLLKTASDPVTAVIRFLHERPEDATLYGYVMDYVLKETFSDGTKMPELVKILGMHVHDIVRHANVIDIHNEHPAAERWGSYLIKLKERIKFEVGKEKDLFVLDKISGLTAVENGIELPVEKISIKPPQLIVTVKLGILRAQRLVDI